MHLIEQDQRVGNAWHMHAGQNHIHVGMLVAVHSQVQYQDPYATCKKEQAVQTCFNAANKALTPPVLK